MRQTESDKYNIMNGEPFQIVIERINKEAFDKGVIKNRRSLFSPSLGGSFPVNIIVPHEDAVEEIVSSALSTGSEPLLMEIQNINNVDKALEACRRYCSRWTNTGKNRYYSEVCRMYPWLEDILPGKASWVPVDTKGYSLEAKVHSSLITGYLTLKAVNGNPIPFPDYNYINNPMKKEIVDEPF